MDILMVILGVVFLITGFILNIIRIRKELIIKEEELLDTNETVLRKSIINEVIKKNADNKQFVSRLNSALLIRKIQNLFFILFIVCFLVAFMF